jgi:hypothetical protein
MEPPSPQPFAHANESYAAPWLRPLLEHIGVPAGRAATISAAEAPTTTGAIRELRSRPAHWNAFLDKLSGMLVSELGDTLDREDIRQRLLERLEEELDAVHVKRARTEAAGSSTEAQFALATTESEEVLRTKQWCNRQPIIVSRFVLRVLRPRPPRRNLWVVCKCGHACLEFDFRKHVISGQHEKEFFELLDNSEALGAQAAVLRVAEMLSDLGQRATCELMAADALRFDLSTSNGGPSRTGSPTVCSGRSVSAAISTPSGASRGASASRAAASSSFCRSCFMMTMSSERPEPSDSLLIPDRAPAIPAESTQRTPSMVQSPRTGHGRLIVRHPSPRNLSYPVQRMDHQRIRAPL